MRVALVSLAIGSQYIRVYNKLFRKSHEQYAKKYKYDYKLITDYLNKDIQHTSTISFNKILVCSEPWSSEYDIVIFIDADIFINPKSPPIHELYQLDGGIGIVDEFSQPSVEQRIEVQRKNGWETTAAEYYSLSGFTIDTERILNTGVLVMQPKKHGLLLKCIFKAYIEQSINHPRKFNFEQAAIGYELMRRNIVQILPSQFNALWGLHKMATGSTNLEAFHNDNFFIHFAGGVDYMKVPKLHKYLTA